MHRKNSGTWHVTCRYKYGLDWHTGFWDGQSLNEGNAGNILYMCRQKRDIKSITQQHENLWTRLC